MEKISKANGLFWKYVSLNIMSMIGLSCFIFADTLCVANGVGANGLAALNIAIPVYSLINGLGLLIGMGGGTQFSVFHGMGQKENAQLVFVQAVKLAAVFGVLFFIIGLAGTEVISGALGADEELMPFIVPYMKTIILFAPAFLLNNVLVCFVRNDGNPQLAMAAMLTGSFSNIVLDCVFVFVFGWGMFGAAIATGIAPLLSMMVTSIHVIKKKNTFLWIRKKAQRKIYQKIFTLGFTSFIMELSNGIVMIFFNFSILSITGNLGVAAYGVIANLAIIVVSIFNGIAQGVQPLVSSSYGQGKLKDISSIGKKSVILAIGMGGVFYLISRLCPLQIISLFDHSGDPKFQEIALEGLKIYFLAFPLMGINVVISAICSAMDKAAPSFLIVLMRGLFLVILLVMILPRIWGMVGVWVVVPAAELITVMVSLYFGRKIILGHSFHSGSNSDIL